MDTKTVNTWDVSEEVIIVLEIIVNLFLAEEEELNLRFLDPYSNISFRSLRVTCQVFR